MAEKETHVWLRTQPSLDGMAYIATVEASDDISFVIDPETALRYARMIMDAIARATYDAAVLRQIRDTLGLPLKDAGEMVESLRQDRPPLSDEFPLKFTPSVSAFDGRPYLVVILNGKPIGQWEIEDARAHALGALEVSVTADLDNAYFRKLTGLYEVGAEQARAVVADIGSHRD